MAATATALSPLPDVSVWGVWGTGLAYYAMLCVFALSNAVIVSTVPGLFRAQWIGLLMGGVILALSIFPQIADWRIDYTLTSGVIAPYRQDMLLSTICQVQMPIGLYNHRGHASLVLGMVALLSLVGMLRGIFDKRWSSVTYLLTVVALLLCRTRGPQLAFLLAVAWLIVVFWRDPLARPLLITRVLGLLAVAYVLYRLIVLAPGLFVRQMPTASSADEFTSGRTQMWATARRAVAMRPIFGWGFDGYAQSYAWAADRHGFDSAYIRDTATARRLTNMGRFSFSYEGEDGKPHFGSIPSNKCHNIFLDTASSVGMPGMLVYVILFCYCTYLLLRRRLVPGLESLAIMYFLYTLTWYDAAQFTHLAWWALSAGFASSGPLDLLDRSA